MLQKLLNLLNNLRQPNRTASHSSQQPPLNQPPSTRSVIVLIILGILLSGAFLAIPTFFPISRVLGNFLIGVATSIAVIIGQASLSLFQGLVIRKKQAVLWCISILITALLTLFLAQLGYSQNYIALDNLYKVSGLSKVRESNTFQDFVPRDDHSNNVNAVSWLWADPFRQSSIRAFVINEPQDKTEIYPNYLRIIFDNKKGFPSNVAIRPKNEMALQVPKGYKNLQFYGRIPTIEKGVNGLPKREKVVISIRIVDRHLTHWEYKQSPGHFLTFEISPGQGWQHFDVNIQDKSKWTLFEPGGNHEQAEKSPDFSIITAVIIVVGNQGDNGPFDGSGTIDIANILFINPEMK